MLSRASRRLAVFAALMVVPLLAEANGFLLHRHARPDFDKACATCRWTADTAAEISPTVALPGLPPPSGVADHAATPPPCDATPRAAPSRGPPLP
jgi:hypothetical protein